MRIAPLMQEKQEILQRSKRIRSELFVHGFASVKQNAATLESGGSGNYDKHSCRYTDRS